MSPVHAESCDINTFIQSDEEILPGIVIGERRAYFQSEARGCGGEDEICADTRTSAAVQGSYLIQGDQILQAQHIGRSVCVMYPSERGPRMGWLPDATISSPAQPKQITADVLAGEWHGVGDKTFLISKNETKLQIDGKAYWPGKQPVRRTPNIGSFSGELTFVGNVAQFKPEAHGCEVTIRYVSPYMLAKDNRMCGGKNVSFTDVYKKENE